MEDTGLIVLKGMYWWKAEKLQSILLTRDELCRQTDVCIYVLVHGIYVCLSLCALYFRTKQYNNGLGPKGPYMKNLRIQTLCCMQQRSNREF